MRHDDGTSSDEDSSIGAPVNPVPNGAPSGVDNGQGAEAPKPLDPREVGMHCGSKNLYSGPEDRRGRFHWQDTIPSDLGKPAENGETAKWALLVRNVKVFNDPRKVVAIHSIVVQSPLLKRLLHEVLKGYPGVTVGLRRLEFSGKFEPIIHRWAELKQAISQLGEQDSNVKASSDLDEQDEGDKKTKDAKAKASSDLDEQDEGGKKTKEHAELFYNLLHKEFSTLIEESQDMMSNGVITYEYLWTVFQPGHLIYTKQDGQDIALKLHNTRYGTDRDGNPCFWISGKYVDWDGTRFGTQKLNMSIYPYQGTRSIGHLAAYPLDYHSEQESIKEKLVERGAKVESIAGSHYKAYHGIAWNFDPFGHKDKHAIRGRIVIDTYAWNKFNPNWTVYVTPLNQKERPGVPPLSVIGSNCSYDISNDDMFDPADEGAGGGMPMDGMFADEGGPDRAPLTTEQKMICSPLVRGYAMKNKLWLNFFINSVREIEWSEGAFDSLVLPANQKELILGFTESQRDSKQMFDDVIEGKGKGIILLLCGPPGVGKTLTAESVAEEMQVPLYMMSAGDLGLEPRSIENKLNNILEMCTRWSAILLLDEADVFLEQRSLHELERNKLVSIFLRILEYYEGIMFLTTNRVSTFDAAFQSRIHISIDYPELNIDSRRKVWKNFLAVSKASGQDNTITDDQLDVLALMNMNGRQIKNVLKTSQLLARKRGQPLAQTHINTVLDVTQHLHNETRETERARSAIFA